MCGTDWIELLEREGGGGGEGDEEEGDDVRSCRLRINEWWF